MDQTMLSAIMWIAAGGILGLYLLRRRKRNVLDK